MNIKLPFASKDGDLVHISELTEKERGLKCNCVCPACGTKVIAKLGDKMQHHFAHSRVDCQFALETSLHIFAKQTIEKNKEINLPPVTIDYESYYEDEDEYNVIAKAQCIKFDHIALEKRLSNIIPDVVLYKNNRPLIVEIAVTHFIDDIKRDKIKELGISTLEINLSSYKNIFNITSKEELEQKIIKDIKLKKWIYNDRVTKEEIKIKIKKKQLLEEKKIKDRMEVEGQKKAKAFEKLSYIIEGSNRRHLQYAKKLPFIKYWGFLQRKYYLNINKLPECINIKIENEVVFDTHRAFWQIIIWDKLIQNKKGYNINSNSVEKLILEKMKYIPSNRDIDELKNIIMLDIFDVKSAVEVYLEKLVDIGVLIKRYNKRKKIYYTVQLCNLNELKDVSIEDLCSKRKMEIQRTKEKEEEQKNSELKKAQEKMLARYKSEQKNNDNLITNTNDYEPIVDYEYDTSIDNCELTDDYEYYTGIDSSELTSIYKENSNNDIEVISEELLEQQRLIEEENAFGRAKNRESNIVFKEKEGICIFCNMKTSDWSIWNGDGTCKCRKCLKEQ